MPQYVSSYLLLLVQIFHSTLQADDFTDGWGLQSQTGNGRQLDLVRGWSSGPRPRPRPGPGTKPTARPSTGRPAAPLIPLSPGCNKTIIILVESGVVFLTLVADTQTFVISRLLELVNWHFTCCCCWSRVPNCQQVCEEQKAAKYYSSHIAVRISGCSSVQLTV